MCMFKKHFLPKISSKPVEVYKILLKMRYSGELVTPYMRDVVEEGETMEADAHWLTEFLSFMANNTIVHAYETVSKATDNSYLMRLNLDSRSVGSVCIFKCEIPPYTPYWHGEHGEIGATKMKIIEEVKKIRVNSCE